MKRERVRYCSRSPNRNRMKTLIQFDIDIIRIEYIKKQQEEEG